MKAAVALLLVVVAMSSVDAGPMRKRFLIEEIQDAVQNAGDWLTEQYNNAKDSFDSLVQGGINFDDAVKALIPLIHSKMTVDACVDKCVEASASVLGLYAVLAHTVCKPACEEALAKLKEAAG